MSASAAARDNPVEASSAPPPAGAESMSTVHDEFNDRSMSVGFVCQRDVDTATRDETACTAAQRMESRSVGSLVVLDATERPIGILTDRDVALRVVAAGRDPAATTVGEIMTTVPKTVPETASVGEALFKMRAVAVRRLPVVDDDGVLIGMLCLDDLLKLHAREFKSITEIIEATSPHSLAEAAMDRP